MKVILPLLLISVFINSSFAQSTDLFVGEWNFFKANVVNVIETTNHETWTSRSCDSKEYVETQKCISPYPDSKVELFVYDQKLNGLCSVSAKEYCWTLLRIIPGQTSKQDQLIIKADPYNRSPGLGYAISANRL